jgi:preprotein translocase subunit SecD
MALFDRFGPAQAGNGQGPTSPQQVQGSPNFQIGNWGNQPNFAGGMQQFMRPPGQMPMVGATAPGGPMPGGPQQPPTPGQPGMPQQQQPPVPGQPAPMPGQPAPMAGAPTASGTMPPNMTGAMQPFLGARAT